MKAADLMVGDWYVNSDGDICKVEKILGNIVWGQGDDVSDSTDAPNPIPLTPEILEKNGWEHNGIFMDKRIDGNIYFSWSDEFGAELYQNNYYMCYCKYVHTLQHALRLCGLNELANNFKV